MPDYVPFLFIGVAIIVGAAIISYGLYAIANAINKKNKVVKVKNRLNHFLL